MNEKTAERMLEYGLAHGLDDMAIRMDFSLVLGPEKIRIFSIEGEPELLKVTFDQMGAKFTEAKDNLQKVLDDLAKVETTQAL